MRSKRNPFTFIYSLGFYSRAGFFAQPWTIVHGPMGVCVAIPPRKKFGMIYQKKHFFR